MGEPVVGEADGLGALEVGVAGEDRVDVLPGALEQDGAQRCEAALGREAGVPEKEGEVGRDLVVAGAAGVELARGLGPDEGPQPGLDVHVDVFEGRVEGEASAFDLGFDEVESAQQLAGIPGGDETDVTEHPGLGA